MSLRLFTAAIVATFFLIAGLALSQPLDRNRGADDPSQEEIDRIRERERTGTDPNMATGTFGTTRRGSASGAADSPPAESPDRSPAPETMSEPAGPGSAERRPGTAVTQ
jgi:hypothetical protein